LYLFFTGYSPSEVTGRGRGIDDEKLAFKTVMIEKALESILLILQTDLTFWQKQEGLKLAAWLE
jgi:hypothetical protein